MPESPSAPDVDGLRDTDTWDGYYFRDKHGRYFPTQADVLAWVARRWPDRTSPIWRAAKLNEEAGEVIGAVIKEDEGRKTAEDIAQETAQAVICCMALAESVGFDLWAEVAREYDRCQP